MLTGVSKSLFMFAGALESDAYEFIYWCDVLFGEQAVCENACFVKETVLKVLCESE